MSPYNGIHSQVSRMEMVLQWTSRRIRGNSPLFLAMLHFISLYRNHSIRKTPVSSISKLFRLTYIFASVHTSHAGGHHNKSARSYQWLDGESNRRMTYLPVWGKTITPHYKTFIKKDVTDNSSLHFLSRKYMNYPSSFSSQSISSIGSYCNMSRQLHFAAWYFAKHHQKQLCIAHLILKT